MAQTQDADARIIRNKSAWVLPQPPEAGLLSPLSALFALRKNTLPAKRNNGFSTFLCVGGPDRGILHRGHCHTAVEIAQMSESLRHFLLRRCCAH
jgi:hypothetical protein